MHRRTQEQMQNAVRLHQAGRSGDAEQIVRDILQREPGNPQVHMVLGKMLRQQGRNDEAKYSFEAATKIDTDLHEAHVHIGDLRLLSGDYAGAETAYGNALKGGTNATLHNKYGTAQEANGDLSGAEKSFRAAVDLDAAHAPALSNLGTVLLHKNRFDEAREYFERALKVRPDYTRALVNLGLLDKQTGRLQSALDYFDRALKTDPADPALITYSGSILQALGRLDEAEAKFKSVLSGQPGYADALACYAELMEWRGEYPEAMRLLEPHKEQAKTDAALALAYARVKKSLGEIDDALAILEPFYEPAGTRPHWYAQLLFTLGQLLDEAGQHDRALQIIDQANSLATVRYEPARFEETVSSLIQFFTPDRLKAVQRSTESSEKPVFIVGMPRSGTSLVEQILAAHNAVVAAGELPILGQLAMELGFSTDVYPDALAATDAYQLDALVQRYLSAIPEAAVNAQRFTDKMPLNFLHLGLIQLFFPSARVIHCKRQPLDVCASCYFQDFIDPALAFSTRQEWLTHYWLQYHRLMRHWSQTLQLEIFDIRYEQLVADTERLSRDLVSFVGLEWDPACLEFYRTRRIVHTASHAQVDRPVYDTAVGRAARLGSGLEILRVGLSDAVDAYESEGNNAGK